MKIGEVYTSTKQYVRNDDCRVMPVGTIVTIVDGGVGFLFQYSDGYSINVTARAWDKSGFILRDRSARSTLLHL